MDKQEEQPKPEEHKSYSNKTTFIVIGVICAVLLLFIAAFFLLESNTNPGTSPANSSLSPSQTAVNPSGTVNPRFNPLINNKEVERIESSLRKKMESAGITISPKPEYKFQYKLDPALQNKSSFRFIKPAIAAATCNISTAPNTLSIYILKDHPTIIDAMAIASTYDIYDQPSGVIKIKGGSSYEYFFSDPVVSQFLKVNETSGTTDWHRVVNESAGASTGTGTPESIAREALQKHFLSDKAVLKKTSVDPINGHTILHYEKNYDDLIMTDNESISGLGASASVCSVTGTTLMNYIDVHITKNNYLQKIVNKTRLVLSSTTVRRASLEEVLLDYPDYTPIDPIVIGGTETSGDVTIDEAVLVWYDYGEMMPQTAYIPMYLTSGRTPSGTRVLTLFPAITKQTMNDTKIPQLSSQSRDALQLYTFNPPVKKSPPGPQNPGEGTPYPTIPGLGKMPFCASASAMLGIGEIVAGKGSIGIKTSIGGSCSSGTGIKLGAPGSPLGGCFGNQIDFSLTCQDPSVSPMTYICSTGGGIPTDNEGLNDPFNICAEGPQTIDETLDLPAGSNPCEEFFKKYEIGSQGTIPLMLGGGQPSFKGGKAYCTFSGSPC